MQNISIKKNAILSIIKQICVVAFPLISIPYVTRVLEPTNFGIYNFGNSIVGYFSLLSALGIFTYAVREGSSYRDDKEKITEFASQMFSINVCSMIITYVLLGITLLLPALSSYRRIIIVQSLTIFLTTIGTDWVNTIFEDYLYITVRYIIFQSLSIVCLFLFVHKPQDYIIYAIIVVGAQSGANILNAIHVRKYVRLKLTFNIEWKKHLKPIFIFFANMIAITIYVNSDITMLGILKSDKEVGIYSFASKIYTTVKQLLNALMVAAIPRLSNLAKSDDSNLFRTLLVKIKNTLIVILFPASMGMIMLGKEIVSVIGGEKYLQATMSLTILSVAIIFSLLATFYSSCVMVPIGIERYIFFATVISALTNILLNLIFIPKMGAEGASITTLISELIVFVICFYVSKKEEFIDIDFSILWKTILGCLVIAGICIVMTRYINKDIIKIAASIIISVPAYFVTEMILSNSIVVLEMNTIADRVCKALNKVNK